MTAETTADFYWVWFYNHADPRLMKRHADGRWEGFASDDVIHDEIDFTDRPPRLATRPAERYIVDDRCGCVAVRDRALMNTDSPGLHGDEDDCVQFWSKGRRQVRCECCDHVRDEYIADDHVDDARALAAKLNAECNATTELLQIVEAWVAEWEATWVDPDDRGHEWADIYRRAKGAIRKVNGGHNVGP